MPVLDRSYRRWEGRPTSFLERMLVIPKHALADVFKRRFVTLFYIVCLLPPLALAASVYASANLSKLQALVPLLREMDDNFTVGPEAYAIMWGLQSLPVIILTLIAGPTLIAKDLANNALPLYFSKALGRVDYLGGKALVLVLLLSGVSWVPLLLVYLLQCALYDPTWRQENGWLFTSILLSSACLIAVLTALVTAISAYVRRERLARVALLGVLFVTTAMAGALNGMTRSRMADVVSPVLLMERVDTWAFEERALSPERRRTRVSQGRLEPVSLPVALIGLGLWVGAAGVLVSRKVRPVEVVG